MKAEDFLEYISEDETAALNRLKDSLRMINVKLITMNTNGGVTLHGKIGETAIDGTGVSFDEAIHNYWPRMMEKMGVIALMTEPASAA